ncbi:MAG: glycosyltransferase [Peptococcaceae bacterium]|nr:glycosyltransferase [Peptococcaceae bacterium]
MRAAAALRSAFREDNPEREVIILDTFKYACPLLEKLVLGTYMEMLRITPAVYGYIYSRSEKGQLLSGYAKHEFNKILSKFSAARLLNFIGRHNPETVVCTHPFPLGVLSSIRREGKLDCLTVGVVTDFIIHPYWVFPEVDLYLVGAERLAGDLIEFGIPAARVHAAGIPIDPSFAAPADPKKVLADYNLDPGQVTILVMGGGLGLGPLAESVETLGRLDRRCQLIVVTGSNTQLRKKLERMVPGLPNRVCVLGYVDNVHRIMLASSIMISKAGGLSCAEAMAAGLPLFIVDPLPGQEERNSQFLTSTGAAVAVAGVHELVEKIVQCLEHPAMLREMSAAASRIGRPDAARDSVRIIKKFQEDYHAGH